MTLAFPPPLEPMLARNTPAIPDGGGWLYEPKWDGFRTLVYFDGAEVYLQSRDLKPMARYFPELVAGLGAVLPGPMVLDGEVVVMGAAGLEFEVLQQRIHPAASRVNKLSIETPAHFVAFDLLALGRTCLRVRSAAATSAAAISQPRRRPVRSLRSRGLPLRAPSLPPDHPFAVV